MPAPGFFMALTERFPVIGGLLRKRRLWLHYARFVPPGHFYSPVLSDHEIERWARTRGSTPMLGLSVDVAAQELLLHKLVRFYHDLPFTEERADGLRYYYLNQFYTFADAIFLSLLIRYLRPRRIVEVGSGFSSAVILDTIDCSVPERPSVIFIDPEPERLRHLLRPDDHRHCKIVDRIVQEVDLALFCELTANDILFIDSSHVCKAGSDVNWLLFEVLPRLQSGVWVHVHDIAADFDYSDEAVRSGVGWNEAYLLRAFLLFNEGFEVVLHVPELVGRYQDWFAANMPKCLKSKGSSIWIRRK
jgi:hypothetical protein